MPVTKVKAGWLSGNLNFKDADGNIIAIWDGTNRKLTFPSGSTLNIATGGIVIVDGKDISTELKALSDLDAELALLEGITTTAAEINLIDGSIAGTSVASKALVLGASKNTDILGLPIGGLKIGTAGAEVVVTSDAGELNILDGVIATAAEINRASDVSTRIVNLTAATLALTEATHDGKIVTINKADGSALTLPAATGSGARFRLFIGTTITSVGTTIKVADATDIMYGAIVGAIDVGTTNNFWLTASDSDTITLNGTTTGGYIGDQIELIDVATNAWLVNGLLKQTGAEATPFSATVA